MIYTLSYTGTTLEALTAFLEAKNAILVDVRYQPFSRNPQWTRKTLTAALGQRYVHVGALGNRNYRGGPTDIADLDAGTAAVETLLDFYPAVALMCVCSDVNTCHRKVVAEALGQTLDKPIEHVTLRDENRQVPLMFSRSEADE